ncbi:MAG: TIGR03986 family CRISPR-associated RAMP protein [Paludibacteraceae bacterium]|nr:TIGR03986 family CRISPR-associated RAMP protein [Paludibacteraceae bacterium]
MATLKAPYNFVPLPKQVYFPEWRDQVSQDIPFADGESGVIELEITALSPIFIRDGEKMKDKDGNILKDNKGNEVKNPNFCQTKDGKYFIPATSLKGMIRSVLEILSYGKLDKHTFQNQSFGIRSLNGKDGEYYRELIKPNRIHCGWLRKNGDNFFLNDCGQPWRISMLEISQVLDKAGQELLKFIYDGDFKKDENKTALYKYELLKKYGISENSEQLHRHFIHVPADNDPRHFVQVNKGGKPGIIVFTGQPGQRKKKFDKNKKKEVWTGKFYEFVFPESIEQSDIFVQKEIIQEFISINKESLDYKKFRKEQLENGKPIPIFFTYNDDDEIEAIGLTYMFKFPAYNNTHDAARNTNPKYLSEQMDLSDCIFGTLNGNPLKGRVMFSHAFASNNPTTLDEIKPILSTPHPSYYPLYVANDETWDTEHTIIKGRKRYPIRNNIYEGTVGTDGMGSPMIPLDKGAVFSAKICYHNMRPIELGALISAILFHNQQNCKHSLGEGKPLGYGAVKVKITNMDEAVINQYLNTFADQMKNVDPIWERSIQLQELFAMAQGSIPAGRDNEFEYMFQDKNTSKFEEGKKTHGDGERFGLFTEIIANKVQHGGNIKTRDPKSSHKHNTQSNEIREQREADEQLIKEIKQDISLQHLKEAKEKLDKLNFTDTKEVKDLVALIEQKILQQKNQDIIGNAQKEAEEKNKALVEGGLQSLLSEKYPDRDEYKVTTFKVCSDKIKKWLKEAQTTTLPQEQFEALHSCIIRLRQNPNKKENNDWNNIQSSIWKRIEELVGKELAMKWFNE